MERNSREKNKSRGKSYLSRLKTATFKLFIAFTSTFVIVMTGALVFFYIEHCYDVVQPRESTHQDYHDVCKYINKTLSIVLRNNTRIHELCNKSLNYKPEKIECKLDLKTGFKYFDLATSIGFTVGYGHVVPLSETGRTFFMIYVMPTIAITMTTHVFCGEIVTVVTELIVDTVRKRCFGVHHTRYIYMQRLLVYLVLSFVFWFGLTANHKMVYPERTWHEGFYYTMATISTVGFGDYYYDSYHYYEAGMQYVMLSAIFAFLSMGTVASNISLINQMILENARKLTSYRKRLIAYFANRAKFTESP